METVQETLQKLANKKLELEQLNTVLTQAEGAQADGALAQAKEALAQANEALAQANEALAQAEGAQAEGALAQAEGALAQADGARPVPRARRDFYDSTNPFRAAMPCSHRRPNEAELRAVIESPKPPALLVLFESHLDTRRADEWHLSVHEDARRCASALERRGGGNEKDGIPRFSEWWRGGANVFIKCHRRRPLVRVLYAVQRGGPLCQR